MHLCASFFYVLADTRGRVVLHFCTFARAQKDKGAYIEEKRIKMRDNSSLLQEMAYITKSHRETQDKLQVLSRGTELVL